MAEDPTIDSTVKPVPAETKSVVTTITEESEGVGSVSKDSRIFGVSIMAWTLLLITLTVCYCQIMSVAIYDHLVNLSLIVIGFYAGKQTGK